MCSYPEDTEQFNSKIHTEHWHLLINCHDNTKRRVTAPQSQCALAEDRLQGKIQEQDEDAFLMRQEGSEKETAQMWGKKLRVEAGSYVRRRGKSGVGNLQPLIFETDWIKAFTRPEEPKRTEFPSFTLPKSGKGWFWGGPEGKIKRRRLDRSSWNQEHVRTRLN